MQHHTFEIPSPSGRTMLADLSEPAVPHCMVIYVHGINGFKDWGGMDLIAEAFAERGVAFLKFNFSHNGTTPESPTEFVDLEAYGNDNYSLRQDDLEAVLRFVRGNAFPARGLPIVMIGHSRGGVDALLYTRERDDLKALVTWAAPSNVETPWSTWDEEKIKRWEEDGVAYLMNGRTGQEMPLNHQLREDVLENALRFDLEQIAAHVRIPWLIVHGSDDEAVPFEQAEKLHSWSDGHSSLTSIQDTGHTFGRVHPFTESRLPDASRKLVEETLDWLDS